MVQCLSLTSRNLVPLTVHDVIFDLLGFYRSECAQSHMQSYLFFFNTLIFELTEKFRSKMKACCWSGFTSFIFRVDCLVSICKRFVPLYVWRKRCVLKLFRN